MGWEGLLLVYSLAVGGASGPSAADRVLVRFAAAREGEAYDVEAAGSPVRRCRTPCELSLPPGSFDVTARGPVLLRERLKVPDLIDGALDVRVERRCEASRKAGVASAITGGAIASCGLAAVLLGLLLELNQALNGDPPLSGQPEKHPGAALLWGGPTAIGAGAVIAGVGAGLGFGLMGHSRLAVERTPRPQSSVRLEGLGLAVDGRGGRLALRLGY